MRRMQTGRSSCRCPGRGKESLASISRANDNSTALQRTRENYIVSLRRDQEFESFNKSLSRVGRHK